MITAVLMSCSSLAVALSPYFVLYVLSVVTLGFACAGVFVTLFVLRTELVSAPYRPAASMLTSSFFALGYPLLSLLAYTVRTWRTQLAICSVCGFVVSLLTRCVHQSLPSIELPPPSLPPSLPTSLPLSSPLSSPHSSFTQHTTHRLLPESPRWLLVQGRETEARRLLCKFAEENGTQMLDCELRVPASSSKGKETVIDLFKGQRVRSRTLILMFCW